MIKKKFNNNFRKIKKTNTKSNYRIDYLKETYLIRQFWKKVKKKEILNMIAEVYQKETKKLH
jgi:hypothetical protein